jgi:hypothetical protein
MLGNDVDMLRKVKGFFQRILGAMLLTPPSALENLEACGMIPNSTLFGADYCRTYMVCKVL